MSLTDGERLITLMLADLMQGLEISGEIDPALVKRLVIDKDDWALRFRYPGVFHDEPGPTDEEVSETTEILSMMSFIEYSIRELPEGERAEFEANNRLRFRGFDGNNDPHHGIAHTLINDLDRFGEFKDRGLNSHSRATLPTYQRLLPIYEALLHDCSGDPFSAEQLRTLAEGLEAR